MDELLKRITEELAKEEGQYIDLLTNSGSSEYLQYSMGVCVGLTKALRITQEAIKKKEV